MIRNAQLNFVENQTFNNKDLTDVGSVVLSPNLLSVLPGQLKRGASGELIYIHPTEGVTIVVDANGNVGNVLSSDKYLEVNMIAATSITIIHTFGRRAMVRVFEGDSESDCSIIYPPGEETTKVVVESNVPITATIFLN